MNITKEENCLSLTSFLGVGNTLEITSPSNIQPISTDVTHYTLELGYDCCPTNKLYNLSIQYDLLLSLSCRSLNSLDDYTLLVSNFYGLLTSEVEVKQNNTVITDVSLNTTGGLNSDELEISGLKIDPVFSGNIDYTITITTIYDTVYILNFTITKLGNGCDGVLNNIQIDYNIPDGIIIDDINNSFIFMSEAFGKNSSNLPDGLYFIGITRNFQDGTRTNEYGIYFVDCTTTCKVVQDITKNPCSKLMLYLKALEYSNDCITNGNQTTYLDLCNIWNILGKSLNLFTENPCGKINDCGC